MKTKNTPRENTHLKDSMDENLICMVPISHPIRADQNGYILQPQVMEQLNRIEEMLKQVLEKGKV